MRRGCGVKGQKTHSNDKDLSEHICDVKVCINLSTHSNNVPVQVYNVPVQVYIIRDCLAVSTLFKFIKYS